jgi:hypothetical protein
MSTIPPGDDDDATDGVPDGLGDGDEITPADLASRRAWEEGPGPATFDRVSIGTTESAVLAIAENLGRLRGRWDKATDVERRALAERIAPEARVIGDLFHDFARWMNEYSVGAR